MSVGQRYLGSHRLSVKTAGHGDQGVASLHAGRRSPCTRSKSTLQACPFNSLFSTHLPRLTITSGFPLPSPFQGTGPTCLSLNPQLSFSPCSLLNPISLLPTSSTIDPLLHSCSLTVDLTQNPFQHLTDQPVLDPDTPHRFTNGSSQKSPPFALGCNIAAGSSIMKISPSLRMFFIK